MTKNYIPVETRLIASLQCALQQIIENNVFKNTNVLFFFKLVTFKRGMHGAIKFKYFATKLVAL